MSEVESKPLIGVAPPPADVAREVPAEVAAIVTRAIRAIGPVGWRWRVWNDFHGMCSPSTGRVIVEVDDLGGFSVDLRSRRVSVAWGLTRGERRAYGSAPAGVQAVRDAVDSALSSRRAMIASDAKTRELPRPIPPALPEGWREEGGMYVSAEGAVEAELLKDSHALVELLTYLRRMTALVEWAQQRQALAALLARRAGGQS